MNSHLFYLRFRLHDANSKAVIAYYEISRILYYARGPPGSDDEACFAFTWANGESADTTVFQCHVFRCHIPEAVNQVSSKYKIENYKSNDCN